MRKLPLRQKLLAYWLFAIVTNLGGFRWIRIVAIDYGGLPVVLAFGVLLLFAVCNNLNFILWGYLERFFGEKSNPFVIAALFAACEHLNPQVFPWYFGAGLDSALVLYQTADLWGVMGLSFVAMTLIHTPWWLWDNRNALLSQQRKLFISLCAFLVFVVVYGVYALNKYDNSPSADKKSVGITLVQSNTTMEKFYGEHLDASARMREFRQLVNLSDKAIREHPDSTDLLVWPEGAVHFPIMRYAEIFDPIAELARKHGVMVAAGSAEISDKQADGGRAYYNTEFVIGPDGTLVGKYRKIQLLAFGEYIPFADTFPIIRQWLPETISHFSRGTEKPVFGLKAGLHWLPLICYEDIIVGFISEFDHRRADFMVNTTNDGWFGKSDASHLHKQMARPRTVEYRKPIVRALNTGSSQIIDAAGRTISRETGLYTQEYINATLHLPATPPVTVYAIIGQWPIYVLMITIAALWLRQRFLRKDTQ